MTPYIIIYFVRESGLNPVQQNLHGLAFRHAGDSLLESRVEGVLNGFIQRSVGVSCPTGAVVALVARLWISVEEINQVLVHADGSRNAFLGCQGAFRCRLACEFRQRGNLHRQGFLFVVFRFADMHTGILVAAYDVEFCAVEGEIFESVDVIQTGYEQLQFAVAVSEADPVSGLHEQESLCEGGGVAFSVLFLACNA